MQVPAQTRFVACLLGGALGDALGYPIEFERPGAAIVARFGATAPASLKYSADESAGLISDDTQMTLFTAEALIEARSLSDVEPTPLLLAAYQRWFATQAMRPPGAPFRAPESHGALFADARLHARRAPGNTCLAALAASYMRAEPASVENPPNGSKGCGAVMRSAPFGLVGPTRELAFQRARDAGVLTHGHPSGYLSAAYFAALSFDVTRDVPLHEALALADQLLAREDEADEMQAIISRTRALAQQGPPSISDIEALGGGWTGEEALAIALVVALTAPPHGEQAEALWRAVAHGGDSDSTGSLVGNLLGAMYGLEALPAAWLAELELADLIEKMAVELWAAYARDS